jgi:short-subunit dehydrogenase
VQRYYCFGQQRGYRSSHQQHAGFSHDRWRAEVFETNFYGTILVSQAFAPILAKNGGGAIINVLSDASWLARPMLAAYSASKSALWSFTNASRVELRNQKTLVLALHVSFMDTDMTNGFEMKKISPRQVAEAALIGIESNREEVLADDFTREVSEAYAASNRCM